jgi:hypothetical protein
MFSLHLVISCYLFDFILSRQCSILVLLIPELETPSFSGSSPEYITVWKESWVGAHIFVRLDCIGYKQSKNNESSSGKSPSSSI